MKKHIKKQITNLGHNNPPEDIKSIEFTNSAMEQHMSKILVITMMNS